MHFQIAVGQLVSEKKLRFVRAALSLMDMSQRDFCQKEGLAYNYFSQVMNRRRVPNERERAALKELLERAPWPYQKESSPV